MIQEIPLKQWRYEEGLRQGVSENAVAKQISRHRIKCPNMRRVNKRVIYVTPNPPPIGN